MRYGAKLGVIPKVREMINVFGGVNRLPGCGENEFAEMSNMTCDCYPRAAAREPRLEVELTVDNIVFHDNELIDMVIGEWQPYNEEDEPDSGTDIETDKTETIEIDQRETITNEDDTVIENPGYGYQRRTVIRLHERTDYVYQDGIGGGRERREILNKFRETTIIAVQKTENATALKFNGEHVFFMNRFTDGEYEGLVLPVLDGKTLQLGQGSGGLTNIRTTTYGAYFVVQYDDEAGDKHIFFVNTSDTEDRGTAELYNSAIVYMTDEYGERLDPTFTSAYGEMPQEGGDEEINEGDTWLTIVGNDTKLFRWIAGEWTEVQTMLMLDVDLTMGTTEKNDSFIFTGDYYDIDEHYVGAIESINGLSGRVRIERRVGKGKYLIKGSFTPNFEGSANYEQEILLVMRPYVPICDHLFEYGGRLWGCRYGEQVNGEFVNEIFCTAARSFTQWQRFTGEADGGPLDTDSFVFNVSEAGAFTGGCVYNGVPTFFKKDTMYRVSGSLSSGFSLYSDSVPGVQEGSSDGICVVNGVLYYKASTGVYAYAGGMPQRVSDKLGSVVMRDAVAGVYGSKAVFFMKELGESRLYIYDTETGAWTIEETDPVLGMTGIDDGLVVQTTKGFYMMSQRMEQMKEYDGLSVNAIERAVRWSCCSGLMGLGNTDRKYVTRIELRYLMPVSSMMLIDVEYDSSGKRIRVGQFQGSEKLETRVASIRLRRCDHFRLHMQGVGACEIVTMTRTVEGGSERDG